MTYWSAFRVVLYGQDITTASSPQSLSHDATQHRIKAIGRWAGRVSAGVARALTVTLPLVDCRRWYKNTWQGVADVTPAGGCWLLRLIRASICRRCRLLILFIIPISSYAQRSTRHFKVMPACFDTSSSMSPKRQVYKCRFVDTVMHITLFELFAIIGHIRQMTRQKLIIWCLLVFRQTCYFVKSGYSLLIWID